MGLDGSKGGRTFEFNVGVIQAAHGDFIVETAAHGFLGVRNPGLFVLLWLEISG